MAGLLANYNFADFEKKWQQYWQEQQIYKWDASITKEQSFIIDTPPPTVSGQLHIGHIFSYVQSDFMVRYHRMLGKNIFFPIGFDDNGLPTERLVEKKKNVRAMNMARDDFIKICQEVINVEEKKFRELFNAIGLSVDWSLEYQTISSLSCKISQLSFLDLVNKGQVYRSHQPVLWDPIDQTALSQADVEDKEKISVMNYISFDTEDEEHLLIATTRPELLPACCAIFFNPNDQRYVHLKNKFAVTPLFGSKVPIIPEETVDINKGSGLVMCCTFGDSLDVMWWKKHQLPTRVMLDHTATIKPLDFTVVCQNESVFNEYYNQIKGVKVGEARDKIVELLKRKQLLVKQQEISQTVKHAERSGAAVEIIMTPQWFIKVVEHKEALLKRSAELDWYPKSMKVKLDNWINCLSWDWCISRQRYFGIPFPVWYSKRTGEKGKLIFADIAQLPVNPMLDLPLGYSKEEVIPDPNVMDTWATSSISPQLSSHGISKDFAVDFTRHQNLFPADLRPQAHEIIRSWAFYTIVKAHLHENTLPWRQIMISGWCLADDRNKMSKSKGNIIVPEKLIQNYSADVVRYWASTSRLGNDCVFSEEILKIGKKLVNKLWNATKFVLQHIKNKLEIKNLISAKYCIDQKIISQTADLWIISKLQDLINTCSKSFSEYEYMISRLKTEEFFLRDFCDNYLELIKSRIYNPNSTGQISAIYSVFFCLKTILELFAPFLPFITEELYLVIHKSNNLSYNSIHTRYKWPLAKDFLKQTQALTTGELAITILNLVRKSKAEKKISVKAPISCLQVQNIQKISLSNDIIDDLKSVTASAGFEQVDNFYKIDHVIDGENIKINVIYP